VSDDDKGDGVFEPIEVDSVPWNSWQMGVRYAGRTRVLSNTRTTKQLHIGVVIEELDPGKQSCPFHYHLLEEEHILMLDGEVTLRLGDERLCFRAGQFVSFPAGAERGHCLINEGERTARYLVIGDNNPHEVCMYPDSGKVQVRGFGRSIFRHGSKLDYWDGEQIDEPIR
jgi:uncharacterized cupin superfamily protein